ncbi:unnamed protein product [Arabis nemorensis]|uniref:Reverse transcriptase zinc-binding domain-containing protein n=1 Tax=Arabis nemorensis TaxID=586526 RepID=A0A565BTJ6_9BRAS|nr:unnamed protein product [Arabis nemorensis]
MVTATNVVLPPSFNWQKSIWQVKTLQKIQSFLWKAVFKAVPVEELLTRQRIQVNGTCLRCGQVESADHVLFLCPYAQKVWDLVPINIRPFSQLPDIRSFITDSKPFS